MNGMDTKSFTFWLIIGGLIVKHGIPGMISIVKTISDQSEPTLEEIEALRNRVPSPDTYFPDKG